MAYWVFGPIDWKVDTIADLFIGMISYEGLPRQKAKPLMASVNLMDT